MPEALDEVLCVSSEQREHASHCAWEFVYQISWQIIFIRPKHIFKGFEIILYYLESSTEKMHEIDLQ